MLIYDRPEDFESKRSINGNYRKATVFVHVFLKLVFYFLSSPKKLNNTIENKTI